MIILDKPYVSDFLQQTAVDLQIPVLKTEFSRQLKYASQMKLMDSTEFFSMLNATPNPCLYSNSENSTEWLNRYGKDLQMTQNINFFKDKSELRRIFSVQNPEVWYQSYSLEELNKLDVGSLEKPFVVKPKRGFASIGIHAVFDDTNWESVLAHINTEVALMGNVFPDTVVSLNDFIIEKYIDGTEIAIDAYFNQSGTPVILNILTHLFGSKADMSDRLYITSDEIIREYIHPISKYLEEISNLGDFRNFPFHLEMRQGSNGKFVPIEINPGRFMGFCVADVEYYFYGINPYKYYFRQQIPDWDTILKSRTEKLYGMFGIDIPKHLDKSKIQFDYRKFIQHFTRPLHYVKIDYQLFPVAIYLFAEIHKKGFAEFEKILYSDLLEFILPGE